MARSTIYVGLEIGTSKICVAVGEVKGDGTIKILGVGHAPSSGVRKGEVVKPDAVLTCLHDALVRAEDRSDVMIRNIVLSVTGEHVAGSNFTAKYNLPGDQEEVTLADIEEIQEKSRDVDVPQDHVFLHNIPRHYKIDGQEGVVNPLGMSARRIEGECHVVHGVRTRIQNSIKCVKEIPLAVDELVFAPIASAQVVLNREAKSRGALVMDIGGGTTDYAAYVDGAIVMSGSLPVGGDHLTSDISVVQHVPIPKAEWLKIEKADAHPKVATGLGMIHVPGDTTYAGGDVDADLLNRIARARLGEVFKIVRARLEEAGLHGALGAGAYLTGGTSLMRGLGPLAADILAVPVHHGGAAPVSGLTATFENPQFATPIGLIRYAHLLDQERPPGSPFHKFRERLGELLSATRIFA